MRKSDARKRKSLISGMVGIVLILSLIMSACSSNSGTNTNKSGSNTPGGSKTGTNATADNQSVKDTNEPAKINTGDIKGEIKLITPWGAGFKAQFEELIKDFNKEYPNVKVTYMDQPTSELAALISAGEKPDVISSNGLAADLRKDNMIEDLTPYIVSDSDITPELYYEPAYKRSVDPDGKVWGLPWHVDPNFALMYNNDVLEQYGFTEIPEVHSLAEFGDFLQRFWVVENGEQVMTTFLPNDVYGPNNSLVTMAYLNGADASNYYNVAENKVTYNDPKIVEALEWIVNFKRQNINDDRLGKLDATLPENTGRFQAGKSLMEPHVTPNLRSNYELNPDLKFAPMPAESLWIGGWSFSLTTIGKKENKPAAWALLKWMTSTKAGAESQQKHFGWISGIKDNPYLEQEAKIDPVTQSAFDVLQRAKKLPPFIPVDNEKEYNEKWAEVMAGKLEPKAFLDHMTKYTQALLDEQIK